MIVTSTSFTSPRAGGLKLIVSRSVFLIRTRAILRVGHTRAGAIAVVAGTHGSFLMRRFKAGKRSGRIQRPFRLAWRSGASNYTAFRACRPCLTLFWASETARSRPEITAWKNSLGLKLMKPIWRRRSEELGRRRPCLWGRRASRLPDDRRRTPRDAWSPHSRDACATFYLLEGVPNFSSDLTRFPGKGRTRSKMRSAIGFAVK